MRLLGFTMPDVDGIDLSPALAGAALPRRELYAESFAPLIEFGWAPLRSVRSGAWKLIAAPKPELFDVEKDPAEQTNVVALPADRRARRSTRARTAIRRPRLPATRRHRRQRTGAPARARLLLMGSQTRQSSPGGPSIRRIGASVAARIAQVTSGELSGPALSDGARGDSRATIRATARRTCASVMSLLQSGDCPRAEPEFHAAAINGGLPSADVHLGLATCLGRRNDLAGAERALNEARRLEPDNPVVTANLGILQAARGNLPTRSSRCRQPLDADPDLHEARFNLALAYAKAGRRAEAASTARDLLARLPPAAPQRAEVERLLQAVQ